MDFYFEPQWVLSSRVAVTDDIHTSAPPTSSPSQHAPLALTHPPSWLSFLSEVSCSSAIKNQVIVSELLRSNIKESANAK